MLIIHENESTLVARGVSESPVRLTVPRLFDWLREHFDQSNLS
jgi:hypothetical protein